MDAKRAENDAKRQEKERLENERAQAEIDNLHARTDDAIAAAVKKGVEAAYAAMQAGQVIAQMPAVAPIARAKAAPSAKAPAWDLFHMAAIIA